MSAAEHQGFIHALVDALHPGTNNTVCTSKCIILPTLDGLTGIKPMHSYKLCEQRWRKRARCSERDQQGWLGLGAEGCFQLVWPPPLHPSRQEPQRGLQGLDHRSSQMPAEGVRLSFQVQRGATGKVSSLE